MQDHSAAVLHPTQDKRMVLYVYSVAFRCCFLSCVRFVSARVAMLRSFVRACVCVYVCVCVRVCVKNKKKSSPLLSSSSSSLSSSLLLFFFFSS